jgi:SAM-dependent methyltransferase
VTRLRDSRVAAGSSGQYVDADLYDKRYGRRASDVRFYVGLAKKYAPVLELGTGTGRIAVAIARAGVSITGAELSPEMLERARERREREPAAVRRRIRLVEGDLRSLRLEKRFRLVLAPFNVFMHLYEREDVERALATVRTHLAPGGRLALDVVNPPLEELGTPSPLHAGPITRIGGRTYRERERYEYDHVRQIEVIETRFERRDDRFSTLLSHRHFFPAELEALLHYNGFTIEARYGDYARRPLTSASPSQVVVARALKLGAGASRKP